MNTATVSALDSRSTAMPRADSVTAPVVYVVDDDASLRDSLRDLIEAAGWHPEVFATAQEFLAHPRHAAPGCLVLDVTLPGLDGLELQRRLADRADLPIIFITGYGTISMSVRAMKAGAIEFLAKPFSADAMLAAIDDAFARSRAMLEKLSVLDDLRMRFATLSLREREVMALVVSGRLNKQVGGELGISEITVKCHRGRVMRKMRATSLPDLVNMAANLRPPFD
jgi:FixJ family two-component response regulator